MSEKSLKRLIVLSSCLVMTLIVANLSALKIWSFFGIPADAGIIVFPLSYMAGDLLAEFYGEKIADFVAAVAAGFGLLTLVVIHLASLLPSYVGADNSSFVILADMAGRIFLASIVSFLLGQLANNRLFEEIRAGSDPTLHSQQASSLITEAHPRLTDLRFAAAFAKRALMSSSAAHAVDAIVFEVIAFYGRLPLGEFLAQIIFAYVVGLILEVLIFPVTYFVALKGHAAS